jgi:transcriptional regulator with XRE-family HTH domain
MGSRLREARERTGISEGALAEALGVNVTSIKAWENDKRTPRANKLVNIAGVLGVSVRWLLEGQAEPTRHQNTPVSIEKLRRDVEQLRSHLASAQSRLESMTSMLARQPAK